MRNARGWILLAGTVAMGLGGCDGNKDTGSNPSDSGGPTGPQSFTFVDHVGAQEYKAQPNADSVRAHQISSTFLAANAIVASDEKVQDRLNTDGGGGYLRAAAIACWTRPEFPMFSFALDYTGCSGYDMAGGVFINDHPSGPLLFEYQDFVVKERTIGGVMAFDTQGAYDAPLYWHAYNTDSFNPSPKNAVQLGVTVDRLTYGVSYDGGSSVDFLNQEWSTWGVMTIGVEGGDSEVLTVVHGGIDPGDVSPDAPTGGDVVKNSLNWLSCRCPTSGIESQDLDLEFKQVTIDIDDLEDVPDAIDDPSLEIDLDPEVTRFDGHAVLTHTGCGLYDVEYDTDGASIELANTAIVGAISFQCATLAIDDEARCQALLAAAAQHPTYTVEITPEQARETALAAVDSSFDGPGWCTVSQ